MASSDRPPTAPRESTTVVTVADWPGSYERLDHVVVPMHDGVSLAARLWIPFGAEANPVPAILEYIPYRKNDLYAVRDQARFSYLAVHGYAGVRLDVRGSGDSEGVLTDEYVRQEQDDALAAIAWIAAQPWCNGAVGMIGKSWGGFNGLQVAARRPPALRAVISLYSTDDRYADDAHYLGGCLLTGQMLGWGTSMAMCSTMPPDPRSVGERWKEMWQERLEAFHPQVDTWLRHQRRDEYWQHGSVCESFADITCAIYAVGGWCDGYRDAVLRLMAGLSCPRKGLIGPWSHQYPMDDFEPGPHVGFLQEVIRFFDHFMKGEDTGIMDEPALRVFLQESVPPATHYPERPGRWVAEPSWPSPGVSTRRFHLNDGELSSSPSSASRPVRWAGLQAAGQDAGAWCAFGNPLDAPADQRSEDGMSLSFTSAPLQSGLVILGNPAAHLELCVDQPNALVVVRLCDVAPDGASTLITRGLLNLTHAKSHEHPQPLEAGKRFAADVKLQSTGQVVPAGHRLRVAVSPTYFPWAWPSPAPVVLSLFCGASFLDLPLRSDKPSDARLRPFDPPETGPSLDSELLGRRPGSNVVIKDPLNGRLEVRHRAPSATERLPGGLVIEAQTSSGYEITEGEPLSARYHVQRTQRFSREDWDARLEARYELASDARTFFLTANVAAYTNGDCFFSREWSFEVPRDLV
jgi:putative CocE/NonD family hydrolase